MIIFGVDPGFGTVGWGVVRYEGNRFFDPRCGAITTPAKIPFERRLELIYDQLSILLAETRPDVISVEELFFKYNITTGIQVAQGRGVILLAACKARIPCYEFTPLQVKQAVTGYGRAEKRQVMEMTRMLLGLEKIPRPDDAADALALAVCCAHSMGISNLTVRQRQ